MYYRGNIDILNEHKSIAVVGSKISAVGAKLAYNADIIGKNSFNLVNGLALGCDRSSKGALAAGNAQWFFLE